METTTHCLLKHWLLPPNCSDVMKVLKKSLRFFVKDGILFRRWLNQALLKCIGGDEVARVIKEVHLEDCDEHQRGLEVIQTDRTFCL